MMKKGKNELERDTHTDKDMYCNSDYDNNSSFGARCKYIHPHENGDTMRMTTMRRTTSSVVARSVCVEEGTKP